MQQSVTRVMSSQLVMLPISATITDAAREMRDRGVGDILILDGEMVCGIVTDRDIVVRSVAEGMDSSTPLSDICSHDLATLSTTDTVDDAIRLMREKHVRRLPVVENNRPLGIVSLGDLAFERDPHSVLADVSSAPANT